MSDLTKLFIVRVYDGFDHLWTDVTGPVTWGEALSVWNRHTDNGTKHTKFDDIDYYRIFPAITEMVFSRGFGENVRG